MLYANEDYIINVAYDVFTSLSIEIIDDIIIDVMDIYDNKDKYVENVIYHIQNKVFLYSWSEFYDNLKDLVSKGIIVYNIEDDYYCNDKSKDVLVIIKSRCL